MKVGIVGCGMMGGSIAIACASNNHNVIVYNRSPIVDRIEKINKKTGSNIVIGTNSMLDLTGCDIVIETVSEVVQLKKEIFNKLDHVCSNRTILASNTSSIPIKELAVETMRPDKVIGLHFSYPAHIMKMCELVSIDLTSKETINIACDLAKSLDKTIIMVKDCTGFLAIRIIIPYMVEAINILESGQATKEDIDAAVKLAFNHPIGVLSLIDFAGLDTIYNICCIMYERLGDPKFAPPKLLKQMVDSGYLGRKKGRGFYEYR